VAEAKSPRDRLLELTVFAPAGLALTLVEEFPKLVDKGRHRVEGQVHTARLVGQFAVQLGRRRVTETLDHFMAPAPGPAPAPPPHQVPTDQHPSASVWARPVDLAPSPADVPAPANGVVTPAEALAIPGYDSLSASQVVQRLDGLSAAELEEVRAHEHAHRQRRTILHRVDQLLAADGDAPA